MFESRIEYGDNSGKSKSMRNAILIYSNDLMFEISYGEYSLFFVSSIAIVNVNKEIRIVRGSMMNRRGI